MKSVHPAARRAIRRRGRGSALCGAVAAVGAALALASLAAAAPQAEQILEEMGFPAEAKQRVLGGEFVTAEVKATSDRELTAALAFLVKVPPEKLIEELQGGLLLQVDPNAKTHSWIEGGGSLDDFKALELSADQVKQYRGAKPGEDLNLSADEIRELGALEGKPPAAVEERVRSLLLGRLQAYRAKGLDGIAPYQRSGGDQTPGGGDLRRASQAAVGIEKHVPAFFKVLNGYPESRAPDLKERFHWMSYEAHGTPVFVLTHAFVLAEGGIYVACQRQFYVSAGYNVEQALAGFFPVEEGTVVVYVNRTSTDQVAGFGGSGKRSIGRRVMSSQLEDLFEKLSAAAAKPSP